MENGKGRTSHNRTVCASPPVGGSASIRLAQSLRFIPTPLLRHSLSALEMLRISLFALPNRRKQPERYVQYRHLPMFLKNIYKLPLDNLF
jgi:hypothetical protein